MKTNQAKPNKEDSKSEGKTEVKEEKATRTVKKATKTTKKNIKNTNKVVKTTKIKKQGKVPLAGRKKLKVKDEPSSASSVCSVKVPELTEQSPKKMKVQTDNEKEGSTSSVDNSVLSSHVSVNTNLSDDESVDSSLVNYMAALEDSMDESSSDESTISSSSSISGYSGSSVSSLTSDSSSSSSSSTGTIISNSILGFHEVTTRAQLAHQIILNGGKILKKPFVVVRPAVEPAKKEGSDVSTVLRQEFALPVFKHLSPSDLSNCALVCRAWARYSIDPCLWKRMDLSHKTIQSSLLVGIVRRQPETLILDWTNITKIQLTWLLKRLPQMKELSLEGCIWVGVSALRTCVCPPLDSLDISYVSGLNDEVLKDIFSPPLDSRPGLIDTQSRLLKLHTLKLSGCDITDTSLRFIGENLACLSVLDVSSCCRISDSGVACLATSPACTLTTLQTLYLSGCRLVTDTSLEHLARCKSLTMLDLRHTQNVTAAAMAKFAVRSKHNLTVKDGKLITKRQS